MGSMFSRINIQLFRLLASVILLLMPICMLAQNEPTKHLYFSEGLHCSMIDKSVSTLEIREKIGYRFPCISVFVPFSISEMLYAKTSSRNYDFQALIGVGLSKELSTSISSSLDLILFGQSTLLSDKFKYATVGLEANFVFREGWRPYYLGIGCQYFKMYTDSIGRDSFAPCVGLGFSF